MKITVEAYEKGLKFRNGRLVEILGPGRYRVASIWAKERIAKVDLRVRMLVLPGEMKAILNQVMEARKKAEAALILRREEVAATRSLANTAEMLARNPTLLHLKELEALERIAGHGGSIVIAPEK